MSQRLWPIESRIALCFSQSANQPDGVPSADRQNFAHRLHLCDKFLPADWESSRLSERTRNSDSFAKTTVPLVSLPLVGPQQALKRWLPLAVLKHHSQLRTASVAALVQSRLLPPVLRVRHNQSVV